MSESSYRTRRANNIDTLVAERIRMHRRERCLSQTDLAGKLGVTFQQIQKYEMGTNRIGAGRLFQLSQIFGVPIQSLFPDVEDIAARAQPLGDDAKRMSDFMLSADGWRLFRAFLQITNPVQRKKIVALVEQMAEVAAPNEKAASEDDVGGPP